MASEWIKLRTDLQTDPAVIRLAATLKLDAFGVIGRLAAVWVWADTHADRHGCVTLVSRECLDEIAKCAGFGAAMESVGWLQSQPEEGGGISFPRFERHMGEGAKARAQAAKRKQKQRSGAARARPSDVTPASRSGHAGVTKTSRPQRDQRREEKRREKEEKAPLPPAEPGGGAADYPAVPATGHEDEPGPEPVAPPPAAADAESNAWAEPLGALIAEWVRAGLPGHDAPGGIEENSGRRGNWQMRLASDSWRGRWRAAVRRAGLSAACRGKDPKFMVHGLRLDTFLKDESMVARILEGEFDGPAARPPARGDPKTDYATRTALAAFGGEMPPE